MKIAKFIAVASVAAALVAGCKTGPYYEGRPQDIVDVPYALAPGRTFGDAVNAAAARRRWVPQALGNGTIRCTLDQREHHVVVDVVPAEGTFSIVYVESNIPNAKYSQWANNLSREIAARAAR